MSKSEKWNRRFSRQMKDQLHKNHKITNFKDYSESEMWNTKSRFVEKPENSMF